jgi:predicted nucleic acid-binding protein
MSPPIAVRHLSGLLANQFGRRFREAHTERSSRRLLTAPSMTSRLVPDAHLAALAIEHGLTVQSTDGDFARFTGLKWENPLAA